jgi:hypothetical protein
MTRQRHIRWAKELLIRNCADAEGAPTDVGGGAAVFSDMLMYTTAFDTGHITPTLALNEVPGVLRLASASANVFSNRQDIHTLTLAIALPEPPQATPKAQVRAAARTAERMAQALVSTRGVPSKMLITSEPDPRARVLWELDPRILLNQDDRLINALGSSGLQS